MFYEKLEKELKQKQINLNQLAKEIGIAQPTTSRWKSGGLPGADALIKLCKYLHISADYLLDLDDEAPPPQLSDQEEKLLEYFRNCDDGTQKSIILLASSGAEQTKRKETSLTSKEAG